MTIKSLNRAIFVFLGNNEIKESIELQKASVMLSISVYLLGYKIPRPEVVLDNILALYMGKDFAIEKKMNLAC